MSLSLILHIPSFTRALFSKDWTVSEMLLIAAALMLSYWLTFPPKVLVTPVAQYPAETPSAPWSSTYGSVSSYDVGRPYQPFESMAETAASRTSAEHPGAIVQRPKPCFQATEARGTHASAKKRKKAKTVVFAEDKNEVRLVENWIVTELHIHSWYNGHVRWDHYDEIWPVENWIEPHGHTQLHFPRTKWIRDAPDPAEEDLDGDIEMLDAGDPEVLVTVAVLVDVLSQLRLD